MRSEHERRTTINKPRRHVLELYRRVRKSNSLVLKEILGRMHIVNVRASEEEGLKDWVKLNWESWVETPRAVPLHRDIKAEEKDL